jgi:lysophospholipase L1-like esterase
MQKKHIIWLLLIGVTFLQACLLISFQHILGFLSPFRVIALIAIELSLGLMVVSILTGKLAVLSITLWLLLLINFAITPVNFKRNPSDYQTLPPNLKYRLEIVGDAMPGFNGVQNISTDEMGFRTTTKINYLNKNSTYRIFTIGGSTTEEIYTDDQKTWSALLQTNLTQQLGKPVEVVNTGFAGLRARQHYKTLEHILPYKPDAAIFLLGINDWNHHIKTTIKAQEATEDKAAKELSQPRIIRKSLDPVGLTHTFDLTKSILWKSVQRVVGKELISKNDGSYYAQQNHSLTRDDWRRLDIVSVSDEYADWITKIIKLCNQMAIQCLFVNQPNAYQPNMTLDLARRLWMTPPNAPYSVDLTDIQRIAKTYNNWLLQRAPLQSCDIATALTASTEHLIDDCHFNPSGSALVADKISQCFMSKFGPQARLNPLN